MPKSSYFGIFGLQFWEMLSCLKSALWITKSLETIKLKLRPKFPILGLVELKSEKILSFLTPRPSNFSKRKVWCSKIKIPKLRTKIVLFGYCWAAIKENYCQVWTKNSGLKIAYLGLFVTKF